jgi:hypothetical protein
MRLRAIYRICDVWPPTPGTVTRLHWPFQLGYFASSNACAQSELKHSAALGVITSIERRSNMTVLPQDCYFPICLKYRRSGGGWSFFAGMR